MKKAILSLALILGGTLGLGCSVSLLGDAASDCYRLEAILSRLGTRCGGGVLAPDVLKCDAVIESSMTSSALDDCQQWADSVDCETVNTPGWRAPGVCTFGMTRNPL